MIKLLGNGAEKTIWKMCVVPRNNAGYVYNFVWKIFFVCFFKNNNTRKTTTTIHHHH